MTSDTISPDRITVPVWCERDPNSRADDRDTTSIQKVGIQQPLCLVRDGDTLLLAKGLRRLRIARSLALEKVPVLIVDPPEGRTADSYARELRLALDIHRQDLVPSQKAELIERLKAAPFNMSNVQVAAYIGIDPDTVTNLLAVKSYQKPIRQAIDAGRLTMQSARVFTGMSPEGQERVWKRHGDELMSSTGGRLHKALRKQYSPEKFPKFYRDPQLVAQRLKRSSGPRSVRKRTGLTDNEKRRLSRSLEVSEMELEQGKRDVKFYDGANRLCIPIIAGILRDEELLVHFPADELKRWAEVYVP